MFAFYESWQFCLHVIQIFYQTIFNHYLAASRHYVFNCIIIEQFSPHKPLCKQNVRVDSVACPKN